MVYAFASPLLLPWLSTLQAPVEVKDCGVNFCLDEASVGKRRDKVSMPKLQELNKVRQRGTT
jgi:hypothetical protein